MTEQTIDDVTSGMTERDINRLVRAKTGHWMGQVGLVSAIGAGKYAGYIGVEFQRDFHWVAAQDLEFVRRVVTYEVEER